MGLPLLPSTPFSIEMPKLYMRQLLPLDIRHYFKKIDWTVCIATNGSHPKGQMTARSGAAGENSLPSHRREKMHLFNDRTYTCQENPPKNGENLSHFGTPQPPFEASVWCDSIWLLRHTTYVWGSTIKNYQSNSWPERTQQDIVSDDLTRPVTIWFLKMLKKRKSISKNFHKTFLCTLKIFKKV